MVVLLQIVVRIVYYTLELLGFSQWFTEIDPQNETFPGSRDCVDEKWLIGVRGQRSGH